MKIKKLTEDAIIPERAHPTDAGVDVFAIEDAEIIAGEDYLFKLGWSCAIPEGWALIVKEKSGRAVKDKLDVGACLIDSSYRGEVHVHLFNNAPQDYNIIEVDSTNKALLPSFQKKSSVKIKKGEKIAQMIMVPIWTGQPEEVEDLDETDRGTGGFGSSGLNSQFGEDWLQKEREHLEKKLDNPPWNPS